MKARGFLSIFRRNIELAKAADKPVLAGF